MGRASWLFVPFRIARSVGGWVDGWMPALMAWAGLQGQPCQSLIPRGIVLPARLMHPASCQCTFNPSTPESFGRNQGIHAQRACAGRVACGQRMMDLVDAAGGWW